MTGGSAVGGIEFVALMGQSVLIFGALFLLGICLSLSSRIFIKRKRPRRLFTVIKHIGTALMIVPSVSIIILLRALSIERHREVSLTASLSFDLSAPLTEAVSQQPEIVTYEKSEDFFRGKLEAPEFYTVEEPSFNRHTWGRPHVKNVIDVSVVYNGRTVRIRDLEGVSLYGGSQAGQIGSLFFRFRKQATWTSKEQALLELSAQAFWLCNEISQLFLETQSTDSTSCEALSKDAVGSPLTASETGVTLIVSKKYVEGFDLEIRLSRSRDQPGLYDGIRIRISRHA